MDVQKLIALIKKNEGPKLDFKMELDLRSESGKKELAKDVIAIANSQGGRGHLIVGIEDKTKRLVGIKPKDYDEERIQQIVGNRCDPPLNLRVEYIELKGKTVLVITIFRSYKKPHQMRQTGAFYIRRGSTTDVARRDEIAALLQTGGIIHNEQIPVFNVDMRVLNMDSVKHYLERMNMPMVENPDKTLLANLGIIHYDRDEEIYNPTVGGLLLFCDTPQLYLPHVGVTIIDFRGKKRNEYHIDGPLIQLLEKSLEKIRTILNETDYPVEAIDEALSNAIVHRDYFDNSREIVIYVGKKRIEISNPGSVYGRELLNNVMRENNPYRRNNWLYHQLLVLDEHDRFLKYGLGMEKIKHLLNRRGKVRFLNLRKINMFKVVLPGVLPPRRRISKHLKNQR